MIILRKFINFVKNLTISDILSIIFCVSGCSYQLVEVIFKFLEFEVNIELTFEMPKTVWVPDFIFCIPFIYSIDFEKFKENEYFREYSSKTENPLNIENFDYNIFSKITLKNMVNYIHSPEKIIKRATLLNVEINDSDQLNGSHYLVDPFFKDNETCYVYRIREERTFNYSDIRGSYTRVYFTFDFLPNDTKISLYLNNRGTKPYGYNNIPVIYEPPGRFFVNYESITRILLKSPYKTKCRNYKELGFENQLHAISHCSLERSLKRFNTLCCGSFIDFNSNFPPFNLEVNSNLFNKIQKVILINCNEIYTSPDCESEKLIPNLQGVSYDQRRRDRIITLSPPPHEVFSTQFYPRTSFLNSIIDCGSVLAFWFGICLINLTHSMQLIVNNVVVVGSEKLQIYFAKDNLVHTLPRNNYL